MNTEAESKIKSKETIEFWFDLSSNYSYLAMMRIEKLCRDNFNNITWKPFLLGPIFQSFGWNTSPFLLQKEKGEYVKHDMIRQCQKYGIPFSWPSVFPRNTVLPMRVAVYGQEEPWLFNFCKKIMILNFAEDKNVEDENTVYDVLKELKLPATNILEKAISNSGKTNLREQTREAEKIGIFGAPMMIVNGEKFWGNDRLEDALDRLRQQILNDN
ncbi:2-hydroxychromene-2-carboxylate isomerase [Billgrantia sp. Q4P2]|uniref:DsbA family protein n=1 Tax=Billgrantia sp. Q4P2 TaxID=3463857 RepID=UPI004057498E